MEGPRNSDSAGFTLKAIDGDVDTLSKGDESQGSNHILNSETVKLNSETVNPGKRLSFADNQIYSEAGMVY